jgi:N-acetylglucosaminyldiphosphoundecaprenol N-acetyl-beta-D-mannosaminyltransferase
MTRPRRAFGNIAGVDFDFLLKAQIPGIIDRWRHAGRRGYITLTNPHGTMMCRRDEEMRVANSRATITLPDGVGVVLAARNLGYGRRHRCTGPALMLEVCDKGRDYGLSHYFYGGAEGVADKLTERLTEMFPGLNVAGTCCPPFRPLTAEEDEAIVARINASKPDIIWVGLGNPKQEKWMASHLGRMKATALIGVGAAFDFHSGNIEWAPGFMRRFGLEWAYRLARNPRRMWRRNLDSPLFLGCVIQQAIGQMWSRLRSGARVSADFFDDASGGTPMLSRESERL